LKFNVNAAVNRRENRGVVAAICRRNDGIFLGAASLACPGISDPASLESIACREALALATDLHIAKGVIFSDSLEVINSLKNKNLTRYASVLTEIAPWREDFVEIMFTRENKLRMFILMI
jgi:hypothetical protein